MPPNLTKELKFEIKQKMEIIRTYADELREIGIPNDIIMKIAAPDNNVYSLKITDDFRIICPEKDNEEIKLRPLPKALYLLFLKHPEGIAFKDLYDYRKELLHIYNRITPRWNAELNEKSIDTLIDPTNNSINEKCSRIQQAFVEFFNESMAKNYTINGKRGEPKKIPLDSNKVT